MKFINALHITGAVALALVIGSTMVKAAEPTKEPVYQVILTKNQIDTIVAGLNLAASTCGNNQQGCVVGLNRQDIFPALDKALAGKK